MFCGQKKCILHVSQVVSFFVAYKRYSLPTCHVIVLLGQKKRYSTSLTCTVIGTVMPLLLEKIRYTFSGSGGLNEHSREGLVHKADGPVKRCAESLRGLSDLCPFERSRAAPTQRGWALPWLDSTFGPLAILRAGRCTNERYCSKR